MKVIVLSDTHMPKKGTELPKRLLLELPTADHIIHAGDWSTIDVYEKLATYAPVTGVHGNIDDDDIIKLFPAKQIITLNDYQIGIVHGHGEGKTTERRAIDTFKEEQIDMLIFGHSHIPILRYFKKKLLINPGSATDKRTNPYYSFAILELKEEMKVQHVFFTTT